VLEKGHWRRAMGVFNEEFVVVRRGLNPGDPSEITINCPDKVGLACDLARIVFEFGLSVTKGGMLFDSFSHDLEASRIAMVDCTVLYVSNFMLCSQFAGVLALGDHTTETTGVITSGSRVKLP